mgnify:FL=1
MKLWQAFVLIALSFLVVAGSVSGGVAAAATSATQARGVNARLVKSVALPYGTQMQHLFGAWYHFPDYDTTKLKATLSDAADVVEPDYIATTDGASFLEDRLVNQVSATAAWGVTKGAGVTIAILDTGVDCTHPALKARCVGDADVFGHGTHVAGLAAGLAPGASIRSYRVMDENGSGQFSVIAQGVVQAASDGARVENLSLGCVGCPSQMMQDAINTARARGTVVVAAAGNHGNDLPSTPAIYAFSVAAVDGQDRLASFSAYGPTVDAAAPGVQLLSTCRGGGYCRMSGTSMAAPVVAGIAALVIAAHPGASAGDVEGHLADGDEITVAHPVGRRVNALRAVGNTPAATPTPQRPDPSPTSPAGADKDAELVALINAERAHYGLAALPVDPALTRIARAHNTTMNDCAETQGWQVCFTHNVPGEPDVWTRLASAGYPNAAGSENIAQGYATPADTVAGWMGSDGHRRAILNDWTAIGCAWDDFAPPSYQGRVMTCDFGRRGGALPTPRPTATLEPWRVTVTLDYGVTLPDVLTLVNLCKLVHWSCAWTPPRTPWP